MKKSSNNEYENCIICRCQTAVDINSPIDSREHYVVGLGQLCEKCYNNLHQSQSEDELLDVIDMDALLKRCRKKNEENLKN